MEREGIFLRDATTSQHAIVERKLGPPYTETQHGKVRGPDQALAEVHIPTLPQELADDQLWVDHTA